MKLMIRFLITLFIFLLGGNGLSHANSIPTEVKDLVKYTQNVFSVQEEDCGDDQEAYLSKSTGYSIEKASEKIEITENEDQEEDFSSFQKFSEIRNFFISSFYLQKQGYFHHYIKNHLRLYKHFSTYSFKSLGIKFCVFRI